MKVSWTEHKTNQEVLQMVDTKENNGHSQKSTEEVVRSYPQTWFITEDNVRRTNTREEGLWKTKNNVPGLTTEDGGRQ